MILSITGCHLLVYPGAFNMTTGPAHWELLIRSRWFNLYCSAKVEISSGRIVSDHTKLYMWDGLLYFLPSKSLWTPPFTGNNLKKLTKFLLWRLGRVTMKLFLVWVGFTAVPSTPLHFFYLNGYFRSLLSVFVEERSWNKRQREVLKLAKSRVHTLLKTY